MRRSLRWRLVGWQAVLLTAVLTGFGAALFYQVRQSTYAGVDGDLLAGARVLEGTLRALPPWILHGEDHPPPPPDRFLRGRRDDRPGPPPILEHPPPPPHERWEPDGHPLPPPEEGFIGRERFKEGAPIPPPPPEDELRRPLPFRHGPPDRQRFLADHLRALSLPREMQIRFRECETPPYFVIWRRDGSILKSEGQASATGPGLPVGPLGEQRIVREGNRRAVLIRGPGQTTILVGRSIEKEQAALYRLGGQILLIGILTLSLGLMGGYWLASSAVAPLASMSETAASITASNLSRRLETKELDIELDRLATILNSMLDRLEAAFRQQIQFTSDASHELRTPLAVILNHLEMALSRERSKEEYRDTLHVCYRAAERMKGLTESLLTLARADSGKLDLRRRNVDLRMIAEECVTLLQPLAQSKNITLTVIGAETEAEVDADRIAQVLTNLVNNAIAYSHPGGSVTVETSSKEGMAQVVVRDAGVGIAESHQEHLFDRFYRADASRTGASGGTGLGLAISKSILEAHGGTIEISSAPGVGTTVTCHLPAKVDPRG